MADALCVRMGCNSAEILKAMPISCSLCDQCRSKSLSFQKSVSIRLPLRPLQTYCHPRRVSVLVNAVVGYPASMTWWTKGNQQNMREINSAQEFVEAIAKAGDKLVLVDFYSVSCRSCKALHPKICQLAADNPDIEVLKVNFYDNNALCRSLKVNILPFFHFYRGEEGLIDAFSCSLTKINKLRAAVTKHKSGHLAMPAPGPVSKHKSGHLAMPAPGPVSPFANRKDLLGLSTPALATAGSVS